MEYVRATSKMEIGEKFDSQWGKRVVSYGKDGKVVEDKRLTAIEYCHAEANRRNKGGKHCRVEVVPNDEKGVFECWIEQHRAELGDVEGDASQKEE